MGCSFGKKKTSEGEETTTVVTDGNGEAVAVNGDVKDNGGKKGKTKESKKEKDSKKKDSKKTKGDSKTGDTNGEVKNGSIKTGPNSAKVRPLTPTPPQASRKFPIF